MKDNRKRRREEGPNVMTTETKLRTENVSSAEFKTQEPQPFSDRAEFTNNKVGDTPEEITTFPDPLVFTPDFSLHVGVYLVIANTAKGKTILTASLAAWANSLGIPACYVSVFEPRSPTFKSRRDTARARLGAGGEGGAMADVTGLSDVRSPFTDASLFWTDVDSVIAAQKKGSPGIMIFDSITDAIKANATERFRGQPTYTGGMQPSDRDFLIQGAVRAKYYNVALLLPINSELIPYASTLVGATEGVINVINVRQFAKSDRSGRSGRMEEIVNIPVRFVNSTLNTFGMGDFKENSIGAGSSGFVGL